MRTEARIDARGLRVFARRSVATGLAGAYQSAFRGRGLVFEELRDYAPGDDVRSIEWNATARLGRPIVKRMREERDLVVAVLLDASRSLSFGFGGSTKRAAAIRITAAIAYAAIAARDRVALAIFSGETLLRVDPGGGSVHMERLLRALGSCPAGAPTDAAPSLEWADRTLPRHSLLFLVSDLLFDDPGPSLRRCARKHEVVVLRVSDPADRLPPRIAPIRGSPLEGEPARLLRAGRRDRGPAPAGMDPAVLRTLGIETGNVSTGAQLVPSLRRFMEARARRRR